MQYFPEEPDALTVAWLDEVLRRARTLADARLATLRTEALDRTGIFGNIVRCRLTYDGSPEISPDSLIAKFAPQDPELRRLILESGGSPAEVLFYQRLAERSAISTPRCYYAAIDASTGAFLLLLEDLAWARPGSWRAGCTPAEALPTVRAAARLHAAWWESSDLAALDGLSVGRPEFVREAMPSAWPQFLERLGSSVPAALVEIGSRLVRHFADLDDQLSSRPLTLIHNDYHLDNMFFGSATDRNPVTVLDWQFLCIDRGMKDVAFFLGGNLSADARRTHEQKLLRVYHSALQDGRVVGYSWERCIRDYRLSLLDAWSRFIFSIGAHVEPDERLPFLAETILPRFHAAILDTQAGDLLPA